MPRKQLPKQKNTLDGFLTKPLSLISDEDKALFEAYIEQWDPKEIKKTIVNIKKNKY